MKKEKVVARWWKLIFDPEDRFEITKKGKKYLRKEKQKESKRNTNKVIKK